MPSDAKKKRDAEKKAAAKGKGKKVEQPTTNGVNGVDKPAQNGLKVETDPDIDAAVAALEQVELDNSKARAVAGALGSHPKSINVKVDQLTVTFHGREIVNDTVLEINQGHRYGLIGLNGSGKSTILQAIYNREMPIPDHIDMYLLSREMVASEETALKSVCNVDEERIRLERLAEELAVSDHEEAHDELLDVYERLDDMDSDKAEVKAAAILHGLGFSRKMMLKRCKEFSGGWRMRIALARALYLKPSILLLDQPTNHLDLDACVWLEQELAQYKRALIIVSHSQDFLNHVCTDVIHLFQKKLEYYGGNYDTFVRTRGELMENQAKKYKWEQDQIAHMKEYIARFGHGSAKLARQAQSKEKTMAKMVAGGLTEKVVLETTKQFYFFNPGSIPPPIIMIQNISFRYNDDSPYIYKDLEYGIDLDTRIALVGPNGAGKSTFLKLVSGANSPTQGQIRRHVHCKIGLYHQHLHEELPLESSALDFMLSEYPEVKDKEQMRSIIGRFGLSGREQVCPIKQLSDGQRCRVSFAWLAWQQPHLLLLDEPTNNLDIESIDALAEAINAFDGGVILVSHDFRLVQQVAKEIYICDNQTITKWEGDIFAFKTHLAKQIAEGQKEFVER